MIEKKVVSVCKYYQTCKNVIIILNPDNVLNNAIGL